jgi:tetratricopeptide (TPR) repeat protein
MFGRFVVRFIHVAPLFVVLRIWLAALKPPKFVRIAVDTAAAAIPARYALERGAWAEAGNLPVRKSAYPYAEAITYFARALGQTRTDDLAQAKESVEKLKALHASYAEKPDEAYWAKQTEVLLMAASAAVARAEGRFDDALKLMHAAADLEDASEKHVAMENRLFPMREQLGYMLLEMNKPALARVEFATAMKAMPNRLRGVFGAARAAQLVDDLPAARALYRKLLVQTRGADGNRVEIAMAKAFFEKKKKGNDND